MAKIIGSPGKYIQGGGELKRLYDHVHPIARNQYFLLVDGFVKTAYSDQFQKGLDKNKIQYQVEMFGGECSKTEIHRALELVQAYQATVLIGIGGG